MRIVQLVLCSLLSGALTATAVAAEEGQSAARTELARLRTELAGGYYARGQYAVALEEVKTALEAASDYGPAYNVQGLIYMDLGELDTAEQSFQRALRIDSTNPDNNHNYGWFLCNKRARYPEAIRYFFAALKNPLYATPVKSIQLVGICALRGNDLAMAEEYLQRADRMLPNNGQTVLGLAGLAYRRGELQQARDLLLRQARLVSPSAESLWLNIRVERKLGNSDVEQGFAKELRTRFPDSPEAKLLAQQKFD
ncbi:type IV pilus biogenesis/stability protein PilW [Chitinimonas lacunae]|uniref:Type IV pilus biogenesis/stability protein PilW n=1 Tax=Chitinimonas lacunae TaxID=1963018 RepID=A0ABV8MPH2_9NEIS